LYFIVLYFFRFRIDIDPDVEWTRSDPFLFNRSSKSESAMQPDLV
jgi:hypothetical protein